LAVRRAALGSAVLIASLAAPAAAAAAPTITPSAPCVRYVGTNPPAQSLGLSTIGWPAASPLTFKIGGQVVGTGTTDANGAFAVQPGTPTAFAPPSPKGNLHSDTLTATNAAGFTVSAPITVVRLIVVVPDHAKPTKVVKYRAFGFQPGAKLYLHVLRKGKVKGHFKLGKPKGNCGTLTKKLRYMPLKHWSTGTYAFWYSHSKKYSKATRIYGYRIHIFKTLG
jgi:hypothetical protein